MGRVQRALLLVYRKDRSNNDISAGSGWDPVFKGLPNAYEGQVEMLCVSLRRVERIRHLHVHVWDTFPDAHQSMLKPLESLRNVGAVTWDGSVVEDVGKALRQRIGDSWERNSFLRLPPEIRGKVYEYLVPCHTTLPFTSEAAPRSFRGARNLGHSPQRRQDRGYTAILRTCRRVYDEATRILYGSNTFQLESPAFMVSSSSLAIPPVQAHLRRIGEENVRRIRRYEIIETGNACCASKGAWIHTFLRLIQDTPRIEALSYRKGLREGEHSTLLEVPKESFLGAKGLRHILCLHDSPSICIYDKRIVEELVTVDGGNAEVSKRRDERR